MKAKLNAFWAKKKKNNKGFTLVELIIVIAIIAILAAVLAPQYIRWVENSRWSNDKNQMEELTAMVKTAIIEATEKEPTANVSGTITVSDKGAGGGGASLTSQLSLDDPQWAAYGLQNNGNHSGDGEQANASKYYKIEVKSVNGAYEVKGSWASTQ